MLVEAPQVAALNEGLLQGDCDACSALYGSFLRTTPPSTFFPVRRAWGRVGSLVRSGYSFNVAYCKRPMSSSGLKCGLMMINLQ